MQIGFNYVTHLLALNTVPASNQIKWMGTNWFKDSKMNRNKKKPLLPSTLFRRGKGDNLTRITLSGFLFYFSAYFALSPDFRGR